jgi:hypothetical protein
MSACIRSLYSSDQWAPGFCLAGVIDLGVDGAVGVVLLAVARGATLSLRVGRGDGGLGLLIRLVIG